LLGGYQKNPIVNGPTEKERALFLILAGGGVQRTENREKRMEVRG
jgi:hypothetical protein